MFGNMMDQLQQMKQKVEESRQKLENEYVAGEAGNGRVKVSANGNRKITAITISDELFRGDREELEDLLITALNRALEEAGTLHESEMQSAAMGFIPPMGK